MDIHFLDCDRYPSRQAICGRFASEGKDGSYQLGDVTCANCLARFRALQDEREMVAARIRADEEAWATR